MPRPTRAAYGGRVRRPLTADDIEELYARARTPEERRATARRLAAWAEQPDPQAGEVSPALLFVSAGEHLTAAGDLREAVVCFRRAVEAGQYVPPDVRCYLHGGLLRAGDLDAARDLAGELPTGDRPTATFTCSSARTTSRRATSARRTAGSPWGCSAR